MKKFYFLLTIVVMTSLYAGVADEYSKKCANCHGASGKQSALGKSSKIAGKSASSIVRDLEGYKAGSLSKHGMGGLMKAQVKNLSSKQIKSLASYISKLPR